MTGEIIIGDAMDVIESIPNESVHCVVTSPPYYKCRSYLPDSHPKKKDEIGIEKCVDDYIENLFIVFNDIWHVLRDDGVFFLNMGDCYNNKSLLLLPYRIAEYMRDSSWILRNTIIWHKPNAIPQSVTDRFTNCHEYIFMFTKRRHGYFFDQEAVREPFAQSSIDRVSRAKDVDTKHSSHEGQVFKDQGLFHSNENAVNLSGRNARDVWTISNQGTSEEHFATFPEQLVEKCIKAGTSAHGCCPTCGAQYVRKIARKKMEVKEHTRKASMAEVNPMARTSIHGTAKSLPFTETVGWKKMCNCDYADVVHCTVLDPFAGSGTVARVAERLGRDWIAIDIDERNEDIIKKRTKVQKELFG